MRSICLLRTGFALALAACGAAAGKPFARPRWRRIDREHPTRRPRSTTMRRPTRRRRSGAVVHCVGSGDCAIPSQVCCRDSAGDTACVGAGGCGALSIPCDDSDGCAAAGHLGWVCCLSVDIQGNPSSVQCMAPSDCASTSTEGRTQMCYGGQSWPARRETYVSQAPRRFPASRSAVSRSGPDAYDGGCMRASSTGSFTRRMPKSICVLSRGLSTSTTRDGRTRSGARVK